MNVEQNKIENMDRSHFLLKNEFGECHNINKSRGHSEDIEKGEKNYCRQRAFLKMRTAIFHKQKEERHVKRSVDLAIPHMDMFYIDYLMVPNSEFVRTFEEKYGISAVRYFNFNQSVLYAIVDDQRFKQVFIKDLEEFWEEVDIHDTKFKQLATIQNLHYWSSSLIGELYPYQQPAKDVVLELVEVTSRTLSKHLQIKSAIKMLFQNQNIEFKEIEDGLYQVGSIDKEILNYLLENYDVIQKVQSLTTMRVRPNELGEMERYTDANITIINHAPTIGIIDTGVQRMSLLQPILSSNGIDIVNPTNPHPYSVQTDHGTSVALLASFGNNYFRDMEAHDIEADAKIFSIKVQDGEVGQVNVAGIKDAIKTAYLEYGVKIFNLSMSVGSKNYNEDISVYAYVLDCLAYMYDLLIFISVGNLDTDDIEEIQQELAKTTKTTVSDFLTYPNHFYNPFVSLEDTNYTHDCSCLNLCQPSESMNNISVGAIAENFCEGQTHGLTLDKNFPAYYTRKYYVDYNQEINGTRFKNYQKNKNLFKPDIVMPGGDQLDSYSKLPVLIPREDGEGLRRIRNSGTSYASPLAANIAAKILCKYPKLKMQTVKALIINSAQSLDTCFLEHMIENLKVLENPRYPNVDIEDKRKLSKMYNVDRLGKYLSGHGLPNIQKCVDSDNKCCTIIVEESIAYDSYKVVNINIPEYVLRYTKKDAILYLTGTLCYKFNPNRGDALSYCPLHISFNFGNSMHHDNPQLNADDYAKFRVSDNNDSMAIKSKFGSWSDDFYPASSKVFSNVQKMGIRLTCDEINKINRQLSLIFRCTGRGQMIDTLNDFSFVLSIEQKDTADLSGSDLYEELQNVNTLEVLVEADLEVEGQV